jgi:2-keto-3-deoxy-L-rhamnonate aldolase RhmA
MKITNQSSEVRGLRRRETHFIVPSVLQPEYLKWPLDVSAMSVILPLDKDPQDALDSVRYANYPPQRERDTALTPVHAFGDDSMNLTGH